MCRWLAALAAGLNSATDYRSAQSLEYFRANSRNYRFKLEKTAPTNTGFLNSASATFQENAKLDSACLRYRPSSRTNPIARRGTVKTLTSPAQSASDTVSLLIQNLSQAMRCYLEKYKLKFLTESWVFGKSNTL